MKRWLYVHRTVAGDPERVAERLRTDLRGLLRRATGTEDTPETPDEVDADGSFLMRLPSDVAGVSAAKRVRVTTGVAVQSDRFERRLSIPVHWHADPVRHAFPVFDGAVELMSLSRAASDLALVGGTKAPLGAVGGLLDATVTRVVAQRTAERLVSGLAAELARAVSVPGATTRAKPEDDRSALLRVGDLMTRDPVVLDPDLPVRAAAAVLVRRRISGAPVVDGRGDLLGVLSEADLLEKEAAPRWGLGRDAAASSRRREALTVGEACSQPARITAPEATLHDAAREMLDTDVARLVVVDDCRVAGILSRSDVLRALLRTDAEIRAAADTVLAELDVPDLDVTVEWGHVRVAGTVQLRSNVAEVFDAVRAVDGVIAVDADLDWEVDDVATPVPMG